VLLVSTLSVPAKSLTPEPGDPLALPTAGVDLPDSIDDHDERLRTRSGHAAEHTIDIDTTAGKLADLRRRTEETLHPVDNAAVEKVHARGKLTARERIYPLLDEGSFIELDALAKHRTTNFGLEQKRPLGDGVVTGYSTVDGCDVCIFSQDVTVFGGSLGEVYGEKIVKVQELAIKTGRPMIGINDGAGAWIQEGVVSLGLCERANNPAMNQKNGTDGAPETKAAAHEHVDIHIERGKHADEEIAALVAVLGATGGTPAPATRERNMWGHPVANLRYAIVSWERVTLLERTYMRR
jgi:hypothetical protein